MTPAATKTFDTSKMPQQREFMESIKKELLYSGSFGAGKSRVGCEKGLFLTLKYARNKGLVLRKTFASLRTTTLDTFIRYVCPPEYIVSFNQETHIMKFANGSEILWAGLDHPEKIASFEAGWIFLDEAIEFTEDDYTMLLGRLRLNTVPFRQLFMATNPASGQHYLYRKFYLENDPDRHVIEANSLENPYNPQDYIDTLLKFKGRYKDRYVLGKWVGYEGLVYDIVDPRNIIVDPFEIPTHWQRWGSIDFGYTNPFVFQWWTKVPEEEETEELHGYYMYREIYTSHHTIERIAPKIKYYQDPVEIIFSDHDAEDRATLEEKGILTDLADKAIGPGIQTTYELLGENQVHIFSDCLDEVDNYLEEKNRPTCTVEEFANYRWSDSKVTANAKEVPIDKDNHGMDAMRYFFHSLLGQGEPQHVLFRKKEYDRELAGNHMITRNRNWGNELSKRNWKRI